MTVTNHSASQSVPQTTRTAVGYVRVSTSMQSEDGLSLDAQRAAITNYCASNGLRLINIYQDVISGAKSDRKGLTEALAQKADVFVVLKFDRLSRSLRHFCQLYEDYFSSKKELVAIREAIRLDSALGRALVNILLVFAQMEREATGERVRETIAHIHASGHFYGKVPFGMKTAPAPDNPRYRILVPDPDKQAIIAEIRELVDQKKGLKEVADILNERGIAPPQGAKWNNTLLYKMKRRHGWHVSKPHNARSHSDEEVKARINQLRQKGHSYQQVANILNEEGYVPQKGKKFTFKSIGRLLGGIKTTKLLTPREYCEQVIATYSKSPSFACLAEVLNKSGYQTPRGNSYWWPAQVRELMAGTFDAYYQRARGTKPQTVQSMASLPE